MKKELERLKEMLQHEDPRTPNYTRLLEHVSTLYYMSKGNEYQGVDATEEVPVVVEEVPVVVEKKKTKAKPIVAEAPSIVAPIVEEVAPITQEAMRLALVKAQGKGVAIAEVFAKHGWKNLSAIPPESYAALCIELGVN
jgi:hypothetical protein